MTFWAVFLWILQYLFQIPQNPTIFYTFFHKIAPFLHVYYTKFDKKISFFENFGFSQKFPVGIGFFQSIKVVNIIFECWKVENVQSNKVDITSYSWTVCLKYYEQIKICLTTQYLHYSFRKDFNQMWLTAGAADSSMNGSVTAVASNTTTESLAPPGYNNIHHYQKVEGKH